MESSCHRSKESLQTSPVLGNLCVGCQVPPVLLYGMPFASPLRFMFSGVVCTQPAVVEYVEGNAVVWPYNDPKQRSLACSALHVLVL